jgi:hypothetical protein
LRHDVLAHAGFFPISRWQDCGGDVDGDLRRKGTVTYTGIYRNGQQMVVDLEADTAKPGTFSSRALIQTVEV